MASGCLGRCPFCVSRARMGLWLLLLWPLSVTHGWSTSSPWVFLPPCHFLGLEGCQVGAGMDGHTGVGRRSGLWGAPALTQEEVLMLVVVRQVFQLLLAVLRREAETVNPSTPRTPASHALLHLLCSPCSFLLPRKAFCPSAPWAPLGSRLLQPTLPQPSLGAPIPSRPLSSGVPLRAGASKAEARSQVTAHGHTRSGLAVI